jgi:hypothetical protein
MTCNKFLQNRPKNRNSTQSDRPTLWVFFFCFFLEAPLCQAIKGPIEFSGLDRQAAAASLGAGSGTELKRLGAAIANACLLVTVTSKQAW